MRSLPRISIARLMGFIALFAVEMALFQRVLVIFLLPPITMALVSLNLGLFSILRWLPPSMSARNFGMLGGGMISIFVLVGYYVVSPPVAGMPLGIAGKAISDVLANLAASQADPSAPATTVLRLAARSVLPMEIILLDLLGLAMIWTGGWIFSRRPGATITPAAIRPESSSPLDDRAVTPL
jgi:hypothetical protein